MADLYEMTPEQLEALAARKRRGRGPDVTDPDRPQAPVWPSEVTLGGHTFHVQPGLADDWEFQEMLGEFSALAGDGDAAANGVAARIVRYVYEEPYDEIMAALRGLHPEDERPHVHTEDVAALIRDAVPKAPGR